MVKIDLPSREESGRRFLNVMKRDLTAPLIIGHRGASAVAPENTLAAFQQAIEDGADGLEFDVRLARDGVPVVIHDPTLNRTGRVNATVEAMTSIELAKVDVGSWFDMRLRRAPSRDRSLEHIAKLADVLEYLQDFEGPIFIELKCENDNVDELTAAVCRDLEFSPLMPRAIVKSFKLQVIPRAKTLSPRVKTAALFAPQIMTILRKEKHLVEIAAEFGADELSVHYSLATRKLMEKAGKRGLPVNVWTTDRPRWIKRAIKLGIRSIITNDPARMIARRTEILYEGNR